MSSAYSVVQYLLNTRQETAVGIGHFLKALLNFAKPGGRTPIIVQYIDRAGIARTMMFSRQALSTKYSSAIDIFKSDFGIVPRGHNSHTNITVTGALFYDEEGTVEETPVLISQESWPDLMAHVHKIFIRLT